MGRCKRYNKKQLLEILNETCPEAMAKLPSPDTFEFKTLNGEMHMLIGSTIKRVRRGSYPLWVTFNRDIKPWLEFETEFTDRGSKLVREEGLNGGSIFGKMTRSGTFRTLVDSDALKAVVAFVFVYCGKMESFMDFGFGKGVKALVESLKIIAARTEHEKRSLDSLKGENEGDAGTLSGDLSDKKCAVKKESVDAREANAVKEEPLDLQEAQAVKQEPAGPEEAQMVKQEPFGPLEIQTVKKSHGPGSKRSLAVENEDDVAAKKTRVI